MKRMFLTFIIAVSLTGAAAAQQKPFLSREPVSKAPHSQTTVFGCHGPIAAVTDVAYEGLKTTQFNWSSTAGGGESGRYEKTPVLSTKVSLADGTCIDAHLSAIVGSRQTYGTGISAITMFQVTLTGASGGPQHMVGHFDFPYGSYGPAVAMEAEHDVDMLSANFFQRVGKNPGDIPPGTYRVDVWWSGGPATPGGAIGADFVLKLYLRQ